MVKAWFVKHLHDKPTNLHRFPDFDVYLTESLMPVLAQVQATPPFHNCCFAFRRDSCSARL